MPNSAEIFLIALVSVLALVAYRLFFLGDALAAGLRKLLGREQHGSSKLPDDPR